MDDSDNESEISDSDKLVFASDYFMHSLVENRHINVHKHMHDQLPKQDLFTTNFVSIRNRVNAIGSTEVSHKVCLLRGKAKNCTLLRYAKLPDAYLEQDFSTQVEKAHH